MSGSVKRGPHYTVEHMSISLEFSYTASRACEISEQELVQCLGGIKMDLLDYRIGRIIGLLDGGTVEKSYGDRWSIRQLQRDNLGAKGGSFILVHTDKILKGNLVLVKRMAEVRANCFCRSDWSICS